MKRGQDPFRQAYKDAVDRQAATAAILRVIADSGESAEPVFAAITRAAMKLVPGARVSLLLVRDGQLHYAAHSGVSSRQRAAAAKFFPLPLVRGSTMIAEAVLRRRVMHVADFRTVAHRYPLSKKLARATGMRAVLQVPLLRKGRAIGTLSVTRTEPGAFTKAQVDLILSFADQAVIAIENARLFNETKEALEHQKASTDILRIVAGSVNDTAPTFEAILKSMRWLFRGFDATVWMLEGGQVMAVARGGKTLLRHAWQPRPLSRDFVAGITILERRAMRLDDVAAARDIGTEVKKSLLSRERRALLMVPLLREGRAIGAISVSSSTPTRFSDKQQALLENFADQAVIAIENARLFNETKEALERQTATADVLKVISASPADVQPVLDAVADRASRFFGGAQATVWLAEGDVLRRRALSANQPRASKLLELPVRKTSVSGRAFLERRTIHIPDIVPLLDSEYPDARDNQRRIGWRSLIVVPMIRKGEAIGTINVWRREVRPFSSEDIKLLETFADQAVIAIENARLFNETKEALEQQKASSEVLSVISGSVEDARPVFNAIVSACSRLFECHVVGINVRKGDRYGLVASTGATESQLVEVQTFADQLSHNYPRFSLRGRPAQFPDIAAPDVPEVVRRSMPIVGAKACLFAPLRSDGRSIGAIWMGRAKPGAFSEGEVALLQSFADQAVVAIKNARLFNETKEALERQTATAEILKVIASSPADIQPVFDAIANSAKQLLGGFSGVVTRVIGDKQHLAAYTRSGLPGDDAIAKIFPAGIGDWNSGKAITSLAPAIRVDTETDPDITPTGLANARSRGYRSLIAVPMIRDGRAIGSITVTRREPGSFAADQIDLLKTFADQAVIAIENVRLFNETKEALEQQTATAEILRVISSSPTDVQPVFDAIVKSCTRLLACSHSTLRLIEGDRAEIVASNSTQGETADDSPMLLDDDSLPTSRAVMRREVVQIPDTFAEGVSARIRQRGEQRGFRSLMIAPMLRENSVVGTIHAHRATPGRFTEKEVALLETFAGQAVIAIENVRLFNETKEALERQTATAEILKVIASSPSDVQPVFDTIVKSALSLCKGMYANVFRYDGELLHFMATESLVPRDVELMRTKYPMRPDASQAAGRVILSGVVVRIEDVSRDPDYDPRLVVTVGPRSMLAVPMMREGAPVGVIVVAWGETGSISKHHEELLQTFADQAVIAIENVRLFNETKEALERQTATAEILKVISGSPTDERPVFDAIVASAARLFGRTARIRLVEDGRLVLRARSDRPVSDETIDEPLPIDRDSAGGRVALDRAALQIPDTLASDAPATARKFGEVGGARAIALAPLMRETTVLGVISVTSSEPSALAEKQMALLQIFADQAVIAIENVRLFNETKEALEQKTAIGEILGVISSSPSDVRPALEAVAERALRICDSYDVRIFLVEPEGLRYTVGRGPVDTAPLGTIRPLTRGLVMGRAVLERRPIQVEDLSAEDTEYPEGVEVARRFGHRTTLGVPLLREDKALGVLLLRRLEVRPFSEKQVQLLQTFADQAAIAIENVRLFNETREALEQQTATAEVLNVISGSITDARPVFDAIARSVLRLYGARSVSLVVRLGERIDRVGYALADKSADDGSQALWPIPLDDKSLSGRAILSGELVHIRDVDTEPGLSEHSRAITQQTGVRSALIAPMYSMGAATGALAVGRRAAGGFSEREIEMIRTFADQAVIAMENVRLFREIQEKSAQLEEASQHKSQFLASMSHELRTPLNALLGFNEMLLGDVYGEVPGDMKPPLAQMQASGKHLLRLINNVLDLAKIEAGRMELALAEYSVHDTVESVRSTLQPLAADKRLDFRAAVPAEIPLAYGDPGRIAQCLMNLAGNSLKFTKAGKVEISVAMDNGLLRYRVADTGVGIPPDKIDGLFTEFKQTDATIASEYGGTGLGLSISKKFVEMHGGRIWAESEPGRGSVFTFEVPLRVGGAGAAA